MNQAGLLKIIKDARTRQDSLMINKGREYTQGNVDRGKNFKSVAQDFGVAPLLVWGIYLHKHMDAIYSYVKTGRVFSEPIEGRMDDAINYLILGMMLIAEEKQNGSSGLAEGNRGVAKKNVRGGRRPRKGKAAPVPS